MSRFLVSAVLGSRSNYTQMTRFLVSTVWDSHYTGQLFFVGNVWISTSKYASLVPTPGLQGLGNGLSL